MKLVPTNSSAASLDGGHRLEIAPVRPRVEPLLVAKSALRARFFADFPGLNEREYDDVPDTVDETPEPEIVVQPGPLQRADVPVGRALAWRMVDGNGDLLLDAGAILPDVAARDLLFEEFTPHCERADEPMAPVREKSEDPATTRNIALADMGLTIGSRLGVRNGIGGVMSTYSSRLIGITPGELIFITVPTSGAGRLALDPRETVEVVAISARAVYLFVCQVESVCVAPAPYIILSKPRVIRRLRERRAERIKVRFPVLFSGAPGRSGSADGMGIAQDLSELGMALATGSHIATPGDTVAIRFYLDTRLSAICVEASGTVRNVRPLTNDHEVQIGYEYGLEFGELPVESKVALRNFVLSRRDSA